MQQCIAPPLLFQDPCDDDFTYFTGIHMAKILKHVNGVLSQAL
jgi:hypothetical protein